MADSIEELATMICGHSSYAYHNDNRDYPIPKDAIKEYLEMGAAFSQQQMMKDAVDVWYDEETATFSTDKPFRNFKAKEAKLIIIKEE